MKNQGKLSQEKEKMLDKIQFSWNLYDEKWQPMPFIRHYPKNPEEIACPNNYNKMVYSEPIDFNGIVHKFYQSIENLDIKDLVPFIDEEYKNLSSFYRRELFNAIDLYLSKISINDFLNNIFNEGYEIYILSNMEYRYNEYTDGIILNNT